MKLTQTAKGTGTQARVFYACMLITGACAIISFIAGSKAGGRLLGFESLIALSVVYYGGIAARRRAQDELKGMDRARRREP